MSNYSSYRFLDTTTDDRVVTITLSRPELRNAADDPMHHELETVFRDVGEEESIRAIVLTGAGKTFCAGGDASSMDSGDFNPAGRRIPINGVRRLVNPMLDIEQPIIGAINGYAAGIGATLH